jgi:hypothetical protein
MPNVTISVPDDLKNEMDKFPEVSWSEISRKAILKYIEERKNPTPKVELDLREARLEYYPSWTVSPSLRMSLKIHNMMDSEVIVDRILFDVSFVESSHQYPVGAGFGLHKRIINPNSSVEIQLVFELPKEKIESLSGLFSSTFQCRVIYTIFLEGFKNPYSQDTSTKIAIDEWKDVVKNVLKSKSSRTGKGEARQDL